MPGGDRTGPMGMGSRSGRAAGYCAGYDVPGYANQGPGRGAGMGGGRHGRRNMFYATGLPGWRRSGGVHSVLPPSMPESDIEMLRARAEELQSELQIIQRRLDAIKPNTASTD